MIKPRGSTYEILERFGQVIAVAGASETIKEHVSCSVETINPGVDTSQFTPQENQSTEESSRKTVLFVGRFVPAKNFTLLIEAFDRIVKNHPESELMLVGGGPRRNEIEAEVARQGLGGHAQFAGYVPNENLPDLYRNATVFALSSKSESYPITLLEAMSCVTPVVAPNPGVIPEIVDNEENGLLYSAGSSGELNSALDELLSNPESCAAYGEAARKKAVGEFDWSKPQAELFELYKTLSHSSETTNDVVEDSNNQQGTPEHP